MAKTSGSANYDPYEIAIAIIALEEGYPLGVAASYLRRDRSGLHKALRRLGYSTRPAKPDPVRQRQDVRDVIAAMDDWDRNEVYCDLRQVRRILRAMPPPPPPPPP